MNPLRFVPIDAGARNGKHHLLRDTEGHQHAGRYQPDVGFTYSGGLRIPARITHYAARNAS
ncbi:hypothetical protein [Aurantiacibacter suaedae]|uniref:hypothetical protein n=1 Tax=Aurantiacibacter suaedae TaxID=2545755 RepID=UPI0010F5FCDE|nr:hypothetical protein [Aurantiacibacter suaedae]